MTRRMQDKVSIITGSTSGLGAATAARFAAEGARVIVSGRNEERGETVVTSIREAGGEATFVRCNLDDEASIEVLVAAAVERYGRLDNVIANAAATRSGEKGKGILEMSNEILELIATNVRGLLWLFKHSLRPRRGGEPGAGGRLIVAIGTSGTRNGAPAAWVWATKAPVMVRSLARSAAPASANCVSSGLIETESEMRTMTGAFRDYVLSLNALPYSGSRGHRERLLYLTATKHAT